MEIGIDLLNLHEFNKKTKNPEFLKKVYHAKELKNKSKLASIFALKEAVMKALGKKLNWKDIEVSYNSKGKPFVKVINNKSKFSCSLSHDKDYLIAVVMRELS